MNLVESLQKAGVAFKTEEPLAKHTTYGIGGPAEIYAEAASRDQLKAVLTGAADQGKPVFVLGNGSNVLVDDGGMRGVVVHLSGEFEKILIEENRVKVGAAVMMPVLVKRCAEAGLSGMEGLTGIPGSVGGGLAMNAGTKLGEIYDAVESVELMDGSGRIHQRPKSEMNVRYRRAELNGSVALSAELKLTPGDKVVIMQKINTYMAYRSQTQPLGTQNVGSVFKNPAGDHAGRLVEAAGLKGVVSGGAQISPKHANFIVNVSGAKARDVKALIRLAQEKVQEKFGVSLEPEVRFVGDAAL